MCSDTKGRIAEAVEEMMLIKPVSKITIGSIMEQTQMKRQTFYCHYQEFTAYWSGSWSASSVCRCNMTKLWTRRSGAVRP